MEPFRKRKWKKTALSAAIVVVALLIIFLLLYYLGNGFSWQDNLLGTSNDVTVVMSSPGDGQSFYKGDPINVQGSIWGGIPSKVLVWDSMYNVPVLATISASNFGVQLYANDLSVGDHLLCVQAQTTEGKWTDVEAVQITIKGYQSSSSSSTGNLIMGYATWSDTYLPQPLAVVFRPVEEVLTQTVVYVSGGTSADDLNGDNIPDQIQQSPTTPRYNPTNVPMTSVIVFGLIIFVIIVLLVYVVRPYVIYRQRLKQALIDSPEKRDWLLRVKSLNNQDLKRKYNREKQQRLSLEEQIKKKIKDEREQNRKPIRIYLTPKKKGGNV